MPASVAMARVRSECQGSVTTTALDHRRLDIAACTARTLVSVSPPELTATTLCAGTPCVDSHCLPASASVKRSPTRLPPTVMMRGATLAAYRSRACTSRAVNTEDGRPSNWAAPSTTIVSDARRSSWRANHHTRVAVTATTRTTSTTTNVTARTTSRTKVKDASPAVAPRPRDRRPSGLQPGDRHAERGARHVVEPDLGEEVDRVGVAAVLAADPEVQVGTRLAALLRRDAHHPADALLVEGLERRHTEDAQLEVAAEERRLDVVAREAPAHLGQVVGAEREELRGLGDLAGGHRRARHLDHRADQGRDVLAGLLLDLGEDAQRLLLDDLQLLHGTHQRHHDLGVGVEPGLLDLGRGLGDRPH